MKKDSVACEVVLLTHGVVIPRKKGTKNSTLGFFYMDTLFSLYLLYMVLYMVLKTDSFGILAIHDA